jgi:hypothetical protein
MTGSTAVFGLQVGVSVASLTPLFAVGVAVVHLFGGDLQSSIDASNRLSHDQWVSVAGGVSVAYVFTHILGDVQAATDPVQPERHLFAFFVHEYVYVFALLGLVVFYGVERFVKHSENSRNDRNEEDAGNGDDQSGDGSASDGVFWAHIGLFVLYNAFLGYVFLHHETVPALLVFVVAVALHLSIVDADMREKHGADYHTWGRWLLAGAVLVGAASGYLIQVSDVVFAALFAFLGGAILLNVFRREFPEERDSQFGAFVLGAGGYTALTLLELLWIQ